MSSFKDKGMGTKESMPVPYCRLYPVHSGSVQGTVQSRRKAEQVVPGLRTRRLALAIASQRVRRPLSTCLRWNYRTVFVKLLVNLF